jgi:hypothetical protein
VAKEKEQLSMSEKRARSPYIDIVLVVCFLFIVIAIVRGCHQNASTPSGAILPPQPPKEASEPVKPTNFRLGKAKSAGALAAPGEVNDLRGAYEQYPKSNAGGDIVKGWARVKPEDRTKIREQLDKDIETSEETLRVNPNDKKAKGRLFISRTLKELALKDFNIKPGEQSAVLQAEDPLKNNK